MIRSATLALVAALLALPATAAGATPEVVPGELIVRWRAARSVTSLEVAGVATKGGRRLDAKTQLLKLADRSPRTARRVLAALSQRADVAFVQPNFVRRVFATTPDDHHLPLQWYLHAVKLPEAWDITTGGDVVVAVVDTGIRNHPDLAGRLLPGYDFISNTAWSNDNDGWDDDPTDTGEQTAASSAQHGIHIAGLIGARGNNGTGIAGVDWHCKILPVRALGVDAGKGADLDIAAAIRWAAGLPVEGAPANPHPADVINLSFGGVGVSPTMTKAVQDALDAGVVVVAAVGNSNADGGNVMPAAIPGVIAVGATDQLDQRAPYSNFGDVVALMAPGGNLQQQLAVDHEDQTWKAGIVSTMYYPTTEEYGYHLYEGTSQAAPIVSGVAALLLAVNPSLTRDELRAVLVETADPAGRCAEGCGAGLVDAAAAVARALELGGGVPGNPGGGGGGDPTAELEFGDNCSTDDQCPELCRAAGAAKICTRFCSGDGGCPSGASCESGLCLPFEVSTTDTDVGEDQPTSPHEAAGTEIVGGCSTLPTTPAPAPLALALALLLVARLGRRRPR